MNTRVPRPMYTGSPSKASSTASARRVLVQSVHRREVLRIARATATTAPFAQGAPPSTSLREPETHSDNDNDLDNCDKNPYPDFHDGPPLLVVRAYPRARVEQTSCSFVCSLREVRERLSGQLVRWRAPRGAHSGGDQPFRTRPKAERCPYLPRITHAGLGRTEGGRPQRRGLLLSQWRWF